MLPLADALATLAPLTILALGALVILVAEPFLRARQKHGQLPWVGMVTLALAGFALVFTQNGQFANLLAWDPIRVALAATVLGCAWLAIAGLQTDLSARGFQGGEPYVLILLATTGAVVMITSVDALAVFVGMELLSLPLYALTAMHRDDPRGRQGAIQYFVQGSVFSAVFLMGAAFLYGATGSTIWGDPILPGREILHLAGTALMLVALLFKLAAVPLHGWAPGAYTGASHPVTGFMSGVVKLAALAVLASLWMGTGIARHFEASAPFPLDLHLIVDTLDAAIPRGLLDAVLVAAVLSLVTGSFASLAQSRVRALMAWSAVGNAGFLLLALGLPAWPDGGELLLAPLVHFGIVYAVGSAAVLAAIAPLSGNSGKFESLDDLRGVARAHPFLGIVLTVGFATLAGLPPTAGFITKFQILAGWVQRGGIGLSALVLGLALVSAAAYFRLVLILWSPSDKQIASIRLEPMLAWALALASVALMVLVILPRLV